MTAPPEQSGCETCALLAAGEDEHLVIFRTMWWRVTLAAQDQRYLGRVFITSRRHVASISELDLVSWIDLQTVIGEYVRRVTRAFGPMEPLNIGCLLNNTYQEPSPQPHVHWHARPRYAVAPVVLGRSWPDPNFGHHYDHDEPLVLPPETLAQLTNLLRSSGG